MQKNNIQQRMNIVKLTLPLLAENILMFLFSFIDMFMLNDLEIDGVFLGDDAVASVGLVTSFMFLIRIFYLMVNAGSGIIITQNVGANEKEKAGENSRTSTFLSLIVAVVLSSVFFLFSRSIISLYGLNPIRETLAGDYLQIFGGLSIGIALNINFSSILRSYGYSKEPMIINIIANIGNIFGNYGFIYGAFGFPQLGVAGVALSTVVSQFLAAMVMLILVLRKSDILYRIKDLFRIRWSYARELLKVGLPIGGEYLAYNIAMLTLNFFVAQMDAGLPVAMQINLPAYNYAFIFARFIMMFGLSIGQGNQIITGYRVGAGQYRKAYTNVPKYFYFAFGSALSIALIVVLFRYQLLSLFSMDPQVMELAASLMIVSLFFEPGRTFNLIIITGLKAAGDVHFPVKMGIASMWGIGVLSALFFWQVLDLGIIGIWLGISLDEWIRGIIMYFRWRNVRWLKFSRIMRAAQVRA
jgi:putative MATE family efflux protein